MSPELEALRQNRSAFASAIAAAVGFALFCLVGAAVLMGWIGPGVRPANVLPPQAAARAQANELGLSPGETVVSAAEVPAPPVKAEAPAARAAPAPSSTVKPSVAKGAEPRRPHKRHHAEPRVGVVHSIRVFPDLWEVRVRFDDGGHRTIRYPRPQHWRVGDRIRYEDGRLVPE